MLIEDMWGEDLHGQLAARDMREYLEVLSPALRGEQLQHKGERYTVNMRLTVPGAAAVPVLVAALGPVMLGIAGELADKTITWMTGIARWRSTSCRRCTAPRRRRCAPRRAWSRVRRSCSPLTRTGRAGRSPNRSRSTACSRPTARCSIAKAPRRVISRWWVTRPR